MIFTQGHHEFTRTAWQARRNASVVGVQGGLYRAQGTDRGMAIEGAFGSTRSLKPQDLCLAKLPEDPGGGRSRDR